MKAKLPLLHAVAWIVLSILIVSGSATIGTYYYLHYRKTLQQDERYTIVAVVQHCHTQDTLKTACLTELLQLSVDKPVNLYSFDLKQKSDLLHEFSPILQAQIKKIKPGTIYIDYHLRSPHAYIGDYANTAIDATGVLMPFAPYYTPKNIPTYILGLNIPSQNVWGHRLKNNEMQLALALHRLFNEHFQEVSIKQIDVSNAFAENCGRREIVVAVDEFFKIQVNGRVKYRRCPRVLRMTAESYPQQLADYQRLQVHLKTQSSNHPDFFKESVVDLRIPQLAFIPCLVDK